MKRILFAAVAGALAFTGFNAPAEAHHRKYHRGYEGVAVSVPASRVAAFRRAYVDRFIGPSGDWIDRKHYYYRPYHYWRGPLVYAQVERPLFHGRSAPTTFTCIDKPYGRVCRQH